MNKEEFLKILNNCVQIITDEYPDKIFYYLDKNIERQLKLLSILNQKINIDVDYNNINKENILFKQELKNKNFLINYDKIWSKISLKYRYNYMETKELIQGWLKETTKWKGYTTSLRSLRSFPYLAELKETTKWKGYTTLRFIL